MAREYAKEGTWMSPGFDPKDMSYQLNWKPIYMALEEYKALPENDPVAPLVNFIDIALV